MNNQRENLEALAIFDAYGYPIALEMKEDISSIMPVEIQSGEFFLPDIPTPWIDIVLIFASTTVATSILSKMGEDIYTKLKSLRVKWFSSKRKKTTANFRITIIVDGLKITGEIPYELNSKEAIVILKSTKQMFLDAYNIHTTTSDEFEKSLQVSTKDLIKEQDHDMFLSPYMSMLSVPRYSLSFEYEYDITKKKWKLRGIHKQK